MSGKTGSIKQLSVGRKDVFLLALEDIHEEEGWNVRHDTDELRGHISQLSDSIKEIGVQQPLTGYMKEGKFIVTDGHCRLLAARLAKKLGADIKAVPVRTEERHSNEADRTLSMLIRNSGKPLSVAEQAEVVKRLLDYGWTEAEVARKTGTSRQHVNMLVKFLGAPEEIKQMVKEGKVSATAAVNQVKEEGGEKAAKTLKNAVGKAEKEGKKKATAKHIKKKRDIIKPIEDFAGSLPEGESRDEILSICDKLRGLIEKEETPAEDSRQGSLL